MELNSSENVYDSHVDDTPGNDNISFEVVDGASGVNTDVRDLEIIDSDLEGM